jgi:hypothetical protein
VSIEFLENPDRKSIYTLEKKNYKLFLFNRTEYFTSGKKANKRIAEINQELSDLVIALSDIMAQAYTIYRREFCTIQNERKKQSLTVNFSDFDKMLTNIKYRSRHPEGGFLAFMNFFNCIDCIYQVIETLYKDQPSTYHRSHIRQLKKELTRIENLAKQLNGPEQN